MINLQNMDGLEFLESVPDNSVDLILTDPPYMTSRETGMDKWVHHVQKQDEEGAQDAKTEEDWVQYKSLWHWLKWLHNAGVEDMKVAKKRLSKMKQDYIKYGSIYGKKYAVTTDYGKWDSEFTFEMFEPFVNHYFRVLRPGGTCIIFFDIWKITNLKNLLDETKFKQIRFLEWIKTNPQPINSKVNYLTNCREIALLGIKKSKPTFNSKYDNAIYHFPLQGGKDRFHPTQKSLPLFEELIRKHSNEGDLVLDTFAGSATTAIAAINTNRQFIGTELDEEFYNKSKERIQKALDNR